MEYILIGDEKIKVMLEKKDMEYYDISAIDIDYENKLLLLTYTNNATDHKEKQKAIYDESNRIINEIINDSMTDEEKIMAIWTYLEDNTKYDTAALETAEKNNFADVSGFEDSFNAYGIMYIYIDQALKIKQ